ncbi:MAG TPA: hypothetical protein VHA05_02725 [Candidatus Saccharimonadales bacterium]|nr:hypothetical protein [Candidatus Saccharimonadales bacterium]
MEVGLLPRERSGGTDDAQNDNETAQEQPVNPRVHQAAVCIRQVMEEQGLKMETIDPHGDFNPDVRRELLGESGEGR